ncbi:MAG: PQQ-dependent sugar dehydrogenase [Trueperaceae bacterium]|nr:PQQ-dependent sugar dehydrogenase [Trueperaceae bacterium]
MFYLLRNRAVSLLGIWVIACFSFAQTPEVLKEGIGLRKVLEVGGGNVRLAQNPANDQIYMLHSDQGLSILKLGEGSQKTVAINMEIGGQGTGLTFDASGTAYVVLNATIDDTYNKGIIRRGTPKDNGRFEWETVASTEPYPLSKTIFNHNYNGIAVSPDGQWLFVNAGSRTDHGELQDADGQFPGLREAPLSSKILRVPADGQNLVLPNDEAALLEGGYLYAWGTRNAFDLAFAPNGDLFATDNGPDADYPEELNWIREGHHYGFPWQFGSWDNLQRFEDYDSAADKLQQPDFTAVKEGYYHNDPDFPEPPMSFTMPIANLGPDAAIYRDLDGSEKNAAELGEKIYTFTPHRSPLGLVFVNNQIIPESWQSTDESLSAFVLSWGAAGGTLSDRGMDVLHMRLSPTEDNYEAVTTQIARNFKNPIDAVLVDNKLYVLEWGSEGAIWELSFEE